MLVPAGTGIRCKPVGPLPQLGRIDGTSGNDEGDDLGPRVGVLDPDADGGLDVGVACHGGLHLVEIDRYSVDLDPCVRPPDQVEAAIREDSGEVTGANPPVVDDAGAWERLGHQESASHLDHAHLPRWDRYVVLVEDVHLDPLPRSTDQDASRRHLIATPELVLRDCARLTRSVTAHDDTVRWQAPQCRPQIGELRPIGTQPHVADCPQPGVVGLTLADDGFDHLGWGKELDDTVAGNGRHDRRKRCRPGVYEPHLGADEKARDHRHGLDTTVGSFRQDAHRSVDGRVGLQDCVDLDPGIGASDEIERTVVENLRRVAVAQRRPDHALSRPGGNGRAV